MSKHLLNTDAVDGLRALAVMHIVLGHHSIYTGYLGDARTDEDGHEERYSRGLDLVGGASMALFYIISGFVMMLGYGSYSRAAEGKVCGSCDRGCLNCCGGGEEAAEETGCCYPCFCEPAVKRPPTVSVECPEGVGADGKATVTYEGQSFEVEVPAGVSEGQTFNVALPSAEAESAPRAKPLDVREFFWKRFARLGPLWYLGNLMALPIHFTNYRTPNAGLQPDSCMRTVPRKRPVPRLTRASPVPGLTRSRLVPGQTRRPAPGGCGLALGWPSRR